jgi:hypothetical protein
VPSFDAGEIPRRSTSSLVDMALRYTYLFDSDYCKNVISRYYRQRPFFLRLHFQIGAVGGILLLAWFSTQAATDRSGNAIVGILIAGALIFGPIWLVRAGAMMKLRSSREFGMEVSVALSPEGLEASGPNGHSSIKWAAYPRSVRYPDGILLVRGGAIRWLPDAALQEGSVPDAVALVRSKTISRSVD